MTPRLIAHRAVTTGTEPHNALTSITKAVAAGVDGIELDVRRTRDGELVLNHDAFVRRRGVPILLRALRRAAVSELATLDEAADAIGGAALLVLDVKEPDLVPRLVTWVGERRVALWCREPGAVRRAADSGKFAEVALLRNTAGTEASLRYIADAAASGASAVSLHPHAQQSDVVRAAHDVGLFVYAWVRKPDAHAVPVGFGVDGLVSDWLDSARRQSGRQT